MKIEDFNNERESRNKRLFVKFIFDQLEYAKNNNITDQSFFLIMDEILTILNNKNLNNFLYFRMLFDLVITDYSINRNRYSKNILLDRATYAYKKSKKKNYFKQYIEKYNLDDIVLKLLDLRDFIRELPELNNMNLNYDVFLSHKYTNKFYNYVLFLFLKYIYNLNVYVDWIANPNLNRKRINKSTVLVLSNAMKRSKYLLFFNLDNKSTTNWMAWEVGYFKGLDKKIGIMDLGDYLTGVTNIEKLSSNDVFTSSSYNGIYEAKSKLTIDIYIKSKV